LGQFADAAGRSIYQRRLRAGIRGAGEPKPGRSGQNALHIAVENAHYELASCLLDFGAEPSAEGPGYTVLHAIPSIRKPGGGDNDPAPDGSGNMTSLEPIKKLAAKGANINARMTKKINFGLTSLNNIGATPFCLAALTADSELMRFFVPLGADPKIPAADGATPLIVAAGLGTRSAGEDGGTDSEVVEAIALAIELGNDPNAVGKNGETAMHAAAYKNVADAVRYLASRGANPDVWDQLNEHGWTPLTIAQGYRFGNFKPSPPTVEALLEVMKAQHVPIKESSPCVVLLDVVPIKPGWVRRSVFGSSGGPCHPGRQDPGQTSICCPVRVFRRLGQTGPDPLLCSFRRMETIRLTRSYRCHP